MELIKIHQWGCLLFQGRWVGRAQGHAFERFCANLGQPSAVWLTRLQEAGILRSSALKPSLGLSPEHAASLAENLRVWAPSILEGDVAEGDLTKIQLEEAVLRLESFSQHLQQPLHPRRNKLKPDAIVKALCAAMNVKDRKHLGETANLAIAAVYPHVNIKDAMKIKPPSATSLSRKQLWVDSAYSCFWRDLLAKHANGQGPVYVWADSSPQGGVDWLLSILSLIDVAKLEQCAAAADFVHRSTDSFADAVRADNKQEQLDLVQQRHEMGLVLSDCIVMHRQLPMALGSGRSDLMHKLKAILHKFFCETQSPIALQRVLSCVRSMCTDMGTEQGLPDVQGIELSDVLTSSFLEPELQAEEAPELALSEDDCLKGHVFPQALLCPGILHVCDNMIKEIDSSLSWWPQWLPGSKSISHLLHSDDLRKRLVGLCVVGTDFEWMREAFSQGCPKPIDWRWNNVVNILPRVLELKCPLQSVWCPQKFSHGSDLRPADQDHLNMDTLTTAIRSPKWWFYSDMILKLNMFSKDFASWAEGCHCHGWLSTVKTSGAHRGKMQQPSEEACQLHTAREMLRLQSGVGDGFHFRCPMAGRRAPELATGALQSYFQALADSYLADLLRSCPPMSGEDMQQVLADFSSGKSGVLGYLTQKLECWDVLPWKFAGLGVENQVKARACAKSCVEAFGKSPQDPSLHHRLTWHFLQPGSIVRSEIEAFIEGSELPSLPNLSKVIWELKFMPTVERVQEGDHSIVNRMIGHKQVSAPFVSCALRIPEIKSLLLGKPEEYEAFICKFAEVAEPDQIAKRFGFSITLAGKKPARTRKGNAQKNDLPLYACIVWMLKLNTKI